MFSELNTQPTSSPVYASLRTSRYTAQNSGPSGSLLLSREEFSFSASCRFIPAHSTFIFNIFMGAGASPSDFSLPSAWTCLLCCESPDPQRCNAGLRPPGAPPDGCRAAGIKPERSSAPAPLSIFDLRFELSSFLFIRIVAIIRVAVGTDIADRPPRGSVRALLTVG